jgi:hypothetical protein
MQNRLDNTCPALQRNSAIAQSPPLLVHVPYDSAGKNSRIWFILSILMTISPLVATAPADKPVRPPDGVTRYYEIDWQV